MNVTECTYVNMMKYVLNVDNQENLLMEIIPNGERIDKMIKNANGIILQKGDVIDIHQTINGYSKFAITNTNPITVYYVDDDMNLVREYEYIIDELLELTQEYYNPNSDLTIVGKIDLNE